MTPRDRISESNNSVPPIVCIQFSTPFGGDLTGSGGSPCDLLLGSTLPGSGSGRIERGEATRGEQGRDMERQNQLIQSC